MDDSGTKAHKLWDSDVQPSASHIQVVCSDDEFTRAAAMVAVPDPKRDPVLKTEHREPVSIGPIKISTNGHAPPAAPSRPPVWRCPRCQALERDVYPDGSWRCGGCPARSEPAAGAGPADPFVPSPEWQLLPDGFVCPPGGEFRMGMGADGQNWARWPSAEGVAR